METKRAIIAVALSLLVLIAWTYFNAPPKTTTPPQVQTQNEDNKQKAESPGPETKETPADQKASESPTTAAPSQDKPAPTKTPVGTARIVEIENKVARYRISEVGGRLISVQLLGMKETSDKDSGPKELIKVGPDQGTMELITHGGSIKGLEQAVYEAQTTSLKIDARERTQSLVLKWVSPEGVEVLKTFTFQPDSYLFGLRAEIKNHTDKVIDDNFGLLLNAKHEPNEGGNYAFKGFGAYVDDKLTEKDIGDLKKEEQIVAGKVSWGGYENSYFLQAIIPKNENLEDKNGRMKAALASGQAESKEPEVSLTYYLSAPTKVQPGGELVLNYELFFGPKRIALLSAAGDKLEKSINMGWFDIVAKPFLYFLNFTYDILGNFGLAIIILTIAVKIVFWPLTQKSYKSMKGMQALQPKMVKLREKYKDDKQRLNQEMMGLYKSHGVNPMGGCLPMIIQIPVFIALYRLLDYAIELRHEPLLSMDTGPVRPGQAVQVPLQHTFHGAALRHPGADPADGSLHVHHPEDDPHPGRSYPGEDNAPDARCLHLHFH